MLKKTELSDPTSCLNKAEANEPVFVLRAKDPLFAQTVRLWATMADGVHEPAKVREAVEEAAQAEAWRRQRFDAKGDPLPACAPEILPPPAPGPWAAVPSPLMPRTRSA